VGVDRERPIGSGDRIYARSKGTIMGGIHGKRGRSTGDWAELGERGLEIVHNSVVDFA